MKNTGREIKQNYKKIKKEITIIMIIIPLELVTFINIKKSKSEHFEIGKSIGSRSSIYKTPCYLLGTSNYTLHMRKKQSSGRLPDASLVRSL